MGFVAIQKAELIYDSVSEDIINITERLAKEHGANSITVRQVLREMDVTNRVFYNRFHNIDEVLQIVYKRTVYKMRESLKSEFDIYTNFYDYVIDVCVKVLVKTYDLKNEFSQYMFEFDSATDENRQWWMKEIKNIIAIGRETNQLRDVDSDMFSYTIWCFIRGFCADAIKRKLTKDEAIKCFKFGLECLISGIMK